MSESRYRENSTGPVLEDAVLENIVGYTDTVYGPYETAAMTESISDVVTPDYRKRIARGEIINNACIMSVSTHSTTGSGYVEHFPNANKHYKTTGPVTAHFKNGVSGFWDGLSASVADPETRCKLVALANIDSTPYAFGEDALETRETLRFLRNPIKSLQSISRAFKGTYYDTIRRRSRIKGGKLLEYVRNDKLVPSKRDALIIAKAHADVWLQYRFAVSPLVRSVSDAVDAYFTSAPIIPKRQFARCKLLEEASDSGDLTSGTLVFSRTLTEELEGHATIMYRVSNPVYDWKHRLGFRVKDWPTTAWQVLPYSFMVDRLFDVTSLSKGLINLADPNVRIIMGCYRTKSTSLQKYKFVDRNLAGFTIHSSEEHTHTQFAYERHPWKPSAFDAVPRFTPKYFVKDATYIADAVALILGNFKMR